MEPENQSLPAAAPAETHETPKQPEIRRSAWAVVASLCFVLLFGYLAASVSNKYFPFRLFNEVLFVLSVLALTGSLVNLIWRRRHSIHSAFMGPQGLRAGWSVLIFAATFILLNIAIDTALFKAHLVSKETMLTPRAMFFAELGGFLAMLGAAAVVALIERRRILDYNLTGPRRSRHFFFGLAAGFLALSALIGALAAGGWLHFGPVAISGAAIFRFGALWGCTFLLVGCVEEGLFRCYGLFTLTRGINFWWALGLIAAICADLAIRTRGNGVWGVYAAAALGLFPCLILHQKSAARSAFWQAAWVTSTFFGYVHTANGGENWVGIFSAGFIGFVLCVSVYVTGSAWWAIGCHAGWDWGETFFYGTADSGLPAQGHYLNTSPAGNPLWSGGADGPEGSLLVVAAILLLLLVLVVYGRVKKPMPDAPAAQQAAD